MCGNDFQEIPQLIHLGGSPPLVRERLRKLRGARCCHRITPACAGTTRTSIPHARVLRDHPRLCGNDYSPPIVSKSISGSPPLVRERHWKSLLGRRWIRITPACAGTTQPVKLRTQCLRDHPRLCGNDSSCFTFSCARLGSPPLVRERLHSYRNNFVLLRITPACAGTTYIALAVSFVIWDHPRLCGNDQRHTRDRHLAAGSPPLVRERLSLADAGISFDRITPACAGTTRCKATPAACWRDHPRLGGNDFLFVHFFLLHLGSPPFVGKRPRLSKRTGYYLRITPACGVTTR